MKNLSKELIEDLIATTQGRWVGITFVKKDGTLRRINGRLSSSKDPVYLTMYDVQKKGFRSVDRSKIKSVRIDGVEINVK